MILKNKESDFCKLSNKLANKSLSKISDKPRTESSSFELRIETKAEGHKTAIPITAAMMIKLRFKAVIQFNLIFIKSKISSVSQS